MSQDAAPGSVAPDDVALACFFRLMGVLEGEEKEEQGEGKRTWKRKQEEKKGREGGGYVEERRGSRVRGLDDQTNNEMEEARMGRTEDEQAGKVFYVIRCSGVTSWYALIWTVLGVWTSAAFVTCLQNLFACLIEVFAFREQGRGDDGKAGCRIG